MADSQVPLPYCFLFLMLDPPWLLPQAVTGMDLNLELPANQSSSLFLKLLLLGYFITAKETEAWYLKSILVFTLA